MWWKIIIFFLMSGVIVGAFVFPSPMNPQISLGPADVYRIFFFHVPQAWMASLAFIMAMVYSIMYLRKKEDIYDVRAVTANKLGLIFAILATVTGSIFAKLTWGEFWNWSEIREVSIFILLVMYGAYFALRSAVVDQEKKASLAAVVSILFAVAAIFLIFVLPRMYAEFSQHPSDTIINKEGKMTMGPNVRLVFFSSLAAFTMLFLWINSISVKIERLARRKLVGE